MRNDQIRPQFKLTIFSALLAGVLLASAQPAAAWSDYGGGYGSSYGGWDVDQQEDREWAQEDAREAGREKRRDEVVAQQAADSAEHAANTDAIIEASKASVQAPRGVYYRKPGFISGEAPGSGAQVIEEAGVKVFYEQGIFWVKQGTQYVVIAAPVGVVVDTIPAATTKVATRTAGEYGYFFGTFYQRQEKKFVIVKPPAGLNVTYLPDGYETKGTKEATLYAFGTITFKPVFVMGVLVYQVVGS
jgi:Ni/Co efflux regulator RcnB